MKKIRNKRQPSVTAQQIKDAFSPSWYDLLKDGESRIWNEYLQEKRLVDSQNSSVSCADMVNHPPHYLKGGMECIDVIEAATQGLSGMEAVCTANIIKYIWRWKDKNGKIDVEKCRWYCNKLIEKLEGEGQ